MTQSGHDWASEWSQRIGVSVAAKRREARMTAEQLAARTRDLGYEVTRSTIANIESGRRDVVTVQQVTVIAMALDVSPVVLMFDLAADSVDLLPGDVMSGIAASEWWSGNWATRHRLTDPAVRIEANVEPALAYRRKSFQLFRALRKAVTIYDRLMAAPTGEPTCALDVEAARHRVVTAATYLAGAVGGHRPHLTAEAVELLDALAARGLFTWPEDMLADITPDDPDDFGGRGA
jgi:transcriptional regulator with XRE-family HTH domain